MWRRIPGRYSYWLVAIPTVALCLGANLVVLAVANALWFKPRGVADIDSIVVVMRELDGLDSYGSTRLGLTTTAEIIGAAEAAGQALTTGRASGQRLELLHPTHGRTLEVAGVTANYFDVLGVRVFGLDLPDRAASDGVPAAIISDRIWKTAFGRSPSIAGRLLTGPKHSVRIAGVAPPGFQGARLGERIDVWIDIDSGLSQPIQTAEPIGLIGLYRLPPHITSAAAQRRLEQSPRFYQRTVVPLAAVYGSADDTMVAFDGDGLLDMAGLLSLVIFICGCATLTVTVMMMLERRRTEFAIRCSLGAGRRKLLSSLGAELGTMMATSLAAAVTLAVWILGALPSVSIGRGVFLRDIDMALDARFGMIAVVAVCAMAVIAMAGPVWQATGTASSSRQFTSTALPDRGGRLRQEILLSVQVASALVCSVIAVQFVQTVHAGLDSRAGFDSASVVFVEGRTWHGLRVDDATAAKERVRAEAASRRVVDRVLATPGVTGWAVGTANLNPMARRQLAVSTVFRTTEGEISVRAGIAHVGPGYLQVLGVEPRSGMLPATHEEALGGRAAVVTSSLARQLWGEGDAVGQSFSVHGRALTSVGVVDTGYGSVQYGAAPAVFIFENRLLADGRTLAVAFRARDAAGAKRIIADALREEFDAETRMEIVTGDELVERDLDREQAGTWLFAGYGAVASILALGGVLALVSYTLRTTRREIGIRAALGASRGRLIRHCAALGGRPVATGALAGAILSPLFTSAAQYSFVGLMQVGALTPVLAAIGLTLAAALIAAWQSRPVISIPPQDLLRD